MNETAAAAPGTRCTACPSEVNVKLVPRRDGTVSPFCRKCLLAIRDMARARRGA